VCLAVYGSGKRVRLWLRLEKLDVGSFQIFGNPFIEDSVRFRFEVVLPVVNSTFPEKLLLEGLISFGSCVFNFQVPHGVYFATIHQFVLVLLTLQVDPGELLHLGQNLFEIMLHLLKPKELEIWVVS